MIYLTIGLGLLVIGLVIFAILSYFSIQKLKGQFDYTSTMIQESAKEYNLAHEDLETLTVIIKETENAVIVMDAEGNFQWVNDGFKRLYKCDMQDIVEKKGKNITQSSNVSNIKTIFNKIHMGVKKRFNIFSLPTYYVVSVSNNFQKNSNW